MAAFGLEALDERAEDGAVVEGAVPKSPMLGVAVAEFERHAAKYERQQHDEDRKIDRRYDDGEGERESSHERNPAENEPCLVAIPDRRDRVHDQIARIPTGCESVEDAHAEVKAVQQHVKEDANAED